MQTKPLSLYHIIKEPTIKKDKTPVLFMFHGYGSDENDLFSFATELQEELFIISVRAPYPMQPYGNAWYAIYFDAAQGKFSDDKQAIESRDKIAAFIDEAIDAYDLDKDNVTLLGFSQGTILSYAVALSYPQKVKNVIALSGYINEDILADNYKVNDFSKLNLYCSHGSVDQVIPVDWARKAPVLLSELGITSSLNEFQVGHGVAPQNFYQFKEWLSTHI
ncbi:phospholipase/carboxylesterase [Aquimarina sp. EL_43]|uniref:alpha/beta hydrolase n=1 Tax=unclassified Aquimarina TaxID=2627091 RepID=UPI0018C8FD64|nr:MULTISPECIES: alpha/beta fold hydrolase [unclassified Aquimarina]MBG6129319.1 phospholipase/carboxylesterase [Aquimarina sp. EL_35]MBG6150384.1 phospholipase/carboxylesterase [Aquimarina sp. EL_32]MBG6168308.1 phospholipase/carboxylesterase [Aquimarina sp. EL_43]